MRKMNNTSKSVKVDNQNNTKNRYCYQIVRLTHLPEDTPKKTVLKTIEHHDLSEARRIAVNNMEETKEWLKGRYSVEYAYYQEKGVGYTLLVNLLDRESLYPEGGYTVESTYRDDYFDYRSGRGKELGIFEDLGLEYPRATETNKTRHSYNYGEFTWAYRVEVNENGYTTHVDFKGENGYMAGFEAKLYCLDRKQVQEERKEGTVDLQLVGISSNYKKPWVLSLLEEKSMSNVSMWESNAFYYDCDPLPPELRTRGVEIMKLLRENRDI